VYERILWVRRPLPEHLPRERVIVPGPTTCSCCGSSKLAKLGEDITETLEAVPRQWKVIQYVREKFTCRACEAISQAPAPFHVISRGRSGANLLAMVLYGKFGLHQPLNRQSAEYAKEGIDLPLSTLADHVGTCAAVLQPLVELIRAHVFAGERIHGDKLLAKTKCHQARLWTYVRDDRPFGGRDPPAAIYYFSRDRHGEHPERHLAGYGGILQADCYGGYNGLYRSDRRPRPITEAACWAHAIGHRARRKATSTVPGTRRSARYWPPHSRRSSTWRTDAPTPWPSLLQPPLAKRAVAAAARSDDSMQ
jgi:transposase